jgi:UDP-N-acetylglucosamine transferase subunit ALG13
VILVTTGTNGSPFDRLLCAVGELSVDEELVVQHGPSTLRANGASHTSYLPFADLEALVRRARLVITHGGVGSILLTLMNRRRPVVVPRLARHGEAIDDHQLVLARRLEELGLVTLVTDVSALAGTLASVDPDLGETRVDGAESLAGDVKAFIDSICEGPGQARRSPVRWKRSTR